MDTHLRVIMSVHVGLNCMTLMCWGTEEQKKKYLVPQAKGEKIATYGLTEPNAGSDAVGIQTTAVKKGDRYVLNGEKVWISLADVADHFLVIAWTDQEKKKNRDHSGLSRLHRGARVQGVQLLHDQGEVGHPRRQHRRLRHAGRRGAGGEPRRRGGRGVPGRHVRPRERPLHRGRRAPPASSAPASTPRSSTRRSARPSASPSASTSW